MCSNFWEIIHNILYSFKGMMLTLQNLWFLGQEMQKNNEMCDVPHCLLKTRQGCERADTVTLTQSSQSDNYLEVGISV